MTFPDHKAGIRSLTLGATADSGLPVDYYVVAGPAEVSGRTPQFYRIPVCSRYPLKVTVFAYQWGRPVEPLVQSAQPVERTFMLTR